MPDTTERRDGPDRRRHPRGGRRTSDRPGFAPLVLVVDRDPAGREMSEAILAKLHFAVAPVDSVEKALTVMTALRPDVIVAREADVARLRDRASLDGAPIVTTDRGIEPDKLVEEIRRALRAVTAQE